MTFIKPEFISESIVGAPLDFIWEGSNAHIGPVETVTKLLERLGNVTICAEISMCAGVLLWGAWRLKGHTPVEHNFYLAEAAFAYQVDWRYVNASAGPDNVSLDELPDSPPALSAMMRLNKFMKFSLDPEDYWEDYYIPVSETFHSSHVVRHILPKKEKKDFSTWLDSLADRMHEIAQKPDEPYTYEFDTEEEGHLYAARHRGDALPPDVLDLEYDYRPEQREELIDKFLKRLNWKNNPYLRTPDEIKALGFQGDPYQWQPQPGFVIFDDDDDDDEDDDE